MLDNIFICSSLVCFFFCFFAWQEVASGATYREQRSGYNV